MHSGHILTRLYRVEINSLQIQLSRTQAGPDRAVKEQQEQNSPNHIQRINLISVHVVVVAVRVCSYNQVTGIDDRHHTS